MEAVLAIIAASDTTSTALANARFYVFTTPGASAALRAELDAATDGAASDVDMDVATLWASRTLTQLCVCRTRTYGRALMRT
jgi:cytochrome P450